MKTRTLDEHGQPKPWTAADDRTREDQIPDLSLCLSLLEKAVRQHPRKGR